jgi:hypothetical protein
LNFHFFISDAFQIHCSFSGDLLSRSDIIFLDKLWESSWITQCYFTKVYYTFLMIFLLNFWWIEWWSKTFSQWMILSLNQILKIRACWVYLRRFI